MPPKAHLGKSLLWVGPLTLSARTGAVVCQLVAHPQSLFLANAQVLGCCYGARYHLLYFLPSTIRFHLLLCLLSVFAPSPQLIYKVP